MRSTLLLAVSWRIYDAAVSAVVWVALVPVTALQILLRRTRLDQLRERLARTRVEASASRRVLVHAVSAGEMAAAGAFVRALAEARPDWAVIVSYGSGDGRTVALDLRRRVTTIEAIVALPWDRRAAMVRWLGTLHVSAVVVVEPEIWPNLYRACRLRQIPLFLANGRVYPRDVGRYRMVRWFFADVLRVPAWIGVQTDSERDCFITIGAPPDRIAVVGSFKFDGLVPPPESVARRAVHVARESGSPMIVAGSTHPAEELLLLRAFDRLRKRWPRLRLILAPRHVKRARALVSRVRACGYQAVAASAIDDPLWAVVVVDRLGELASLYRLADVAFVGGTLIDRGGHNVLEPARAGRAIVVGPHVRNIQEVVAGLVSRHGIMQLSEVSAEALEAAFGRLLSDDVGRRSMGARARLYCAQNRGAARRSVAAVINRIGTGTEVVNERDPQLVPRETWPLGASEAKS